MTADTYDEVGDRIQASLDAHARADRAHWWQPLKRHRARREAAALFAEAQFHGRAFLRELQR